MKAYKMSKKNKELLEVLQKQVAAIPVKDGWILKFDSDTLADLLDKSLESKTNSVIVFIKSPPTN